MSYGVKKSKPKRRISLHLSTVMVVMVLFVGGCIAVLTYLQDVSLLEKAAVSSFKRSAASAGQRVSYAYANPTLLAEIVSRHPIMDTVSLSERLAYLPDLAAELERDATLKSSYVGYPDGAFFMVRNLVGPLDAAQFNAPTGTRWMVQSIERSLTSANDDHGVFLFYDAEFRQLGSVAQPDYHLYDPRRRPWFASAMDTNDVVRTEAYVFFSSQTVGATVARRGPSGAVAGVDLSLKDLSDWLKDTLPSANARAILFTDEGKLIAHSRSESLVLPPREAASAAYLATLQDLPDALFWILWDRVKSVLETDEDSLERISLGDVGYRTLTARIGNDPTNLMYFSIAVPEYELFAAARAAAQFTMMTVLALILLAIPVTILVSRQVAKPLVKLAEDSEAVRRFQFSGQRYDDTGLLEVDSLGNAHESMRDTIRRFLDINTLITGEDNFEKLTEDILTQTAEIVGSNYGVLYLRSDDDTHLEPAATTDTTPLSAVTPIGIDDPGGPTRKAVLSIASTNMPLNRNDYAYLGFQTPPEDVDADLQYHLVSVPLTDRTGDLIGLLALVRPIKGDGALVRFVEALSGTSAAAIQTQRLIRDQKLLFQAFIELIAGAVDAKSPYTGGHCERVPELTKMLAQAACEAKTGPYAGFGLDEREWEAVHVASWLHDCGKVTTPEFVVDKATKLETLYDRIHEIRMRFEVMKREVEIELLQQRVGGHLTADAFDTALRDRLAVLDDDFAFVASCNTGGEFMDQEKQQRLKTIAGKHWTRTLDDRLGISNEEATRKARIPVQPLPCSEPLLADRPDHKIERHREERFGPNNPWGFTMPVPTLLYDRGEILNLCVARGTLTNEERFKINEHIIQTIMMLSTLPFPRHLRHVPEIAGGHHEKMDGTGYPKSLTQAQMSPVARMMAIADIFEALTAVDRPYKSGKTLSQALKIMGFMVKDQHIDKELFALFLTSGVWKTYGETFLLPEQIDAVNINDYLPQETQPSAAAE